MTDPAVVLEILRIALRLESEPDPEYYSGLGGAVQVWLRTHDVSEYEFDNLWYAAIAARRAAGRTLRDDASYRDTLLAAIHAVVAESFGELDELGGEA